MTSIIIDELLNTRLSWLNITPLGLPVVPLVYIKHAHVPGFYF